MKSSIVTKILIGGAIAVSMAACSGRQGSDANQEGDYSREISSEPIAFDIMTAERSYKVTDNGLDYNFYMTLTANVQWPTKISEYDIRPLQDSLMVRLFPSVKADDIYGAIHSYLKDVNIYQLPGKYEVTDSVPTESAFNNVYYNTASATIEEVTTDLVTFNIFNVQYTGGAHPLSASFPFTYDLKTGNVVTIENLFEKGKDAEIAEVISQQIALQMNVSPEELKQSLLVDSIPVSNVVYISDGQIVFHYNQYEILPYSFGEINAAVSPYLVQDYLTPAARKLLTMD